MKTRLRTVNVTQRDIDRGQKQDACYCPIARAINRVCESEWFAYVHGDFISFGKPKKCLSLPKEAKLFVDNFDSKKPVRPFKFKMELPV